LWLLWLQLHYRPWHLITETEEAAEADENLRVNRYHHDSISLKEEKETQDYHLTSSYSLSSTEQ